MHSLGDKIFNKITRKPKYGRYSLVIGRSYTNLQVEAYRVIVGLSHEILEVAYIFTFQGNISPPTPLSVSVSAVPIWEQVFSENQGQKAAYDMTKS